MYIVPLIQAHHAEDTHSIYLLHIVSSTHLIKERVLCSFPGAGCLQLIADGRLHYWIDASSLQLASLNHVDPNLLGGKCEKPGELLLNVHRNRTRGYCSPANPSPCLGDWHEQPFSFELFCAYVRRTVLAIATGLDNYCTWERLTFVRNSRSNRPS